MFGNMARKVAGSNRNNIRGESLMPLIRMPWRAGKSYTLKFSPFSPITSVTSACSNTDETAVYLNVKKSWWGG
jgi:hypothetical protein